MYRWGVVLLCLLAGCSALSPSTQKDLQINKSNGINMEEALFIAKGQLRGSKHNKEYKEKTAVALKSIMVRPYPEHWFIEFAPRKFTMSFWSYLVVINKDTGDVVFSDPYIPLEIIDYEWLFRGEKDWQRR